MYVFWFLVVLAVFLVWLVLSRIYRPLGRVGLRIWKNALDRMDDEPDSSSAPANDSQNTNKGVL